MKTLYLLRHAKSGSPSSRMDDFERALDDRGRLAAPAIGAWMRREGRVPGLAYHSTARRAVETWRLVAPELGAEITGIADETLYLATPEQLFTTVTSAPDGHASVLIVGHNPGLHEFALGLVGDGPDGEIARLREGYPVGALAEIRFDVDRWSVIGAKSGRLERLVFPRDLD